MKNVIKRMGVLLMLSVLMVGCATMSPRNFERTVADAERNGANYTKEDWEKADAKFETFCEQYDYDKLRTMSEDEQREVGRLMARYTKARAKSAMKDLDGMLKTGAALLQGFFEGLGLEIGDDDKDEE